jgi:uncharacterized protein
MKAMGQVYLRVYEELNDYLPADHRKCGFECALDSAGLVGDLLDRLCVPRAEVDFILVNGEPADFSRRLQDGDSVSVYPVFESLEMKSVARMRARPLRRTRFIVDGMSRLALYLRLFGFDVRASGSRTGEQLIGLAESEKRILLTKDPGLLTYPELSRVYRVRESEPKRQLREVFSRFDLFRSPHFSLLQALVARALALQRATSDIQR